MTHSSGKVPEQARGQWGIFDVLALTVVVVAGVSVLVPALVHGTFLGPYDILQNTGLNKVQNAKVHNSTLLDQIALFIPWTNLGWTQVHQGHLPLWNPSSALGLPLAFNWESAPFSLPALVGYLFPVRLAYTAQIVVTVVIAGTGVYVLGKVVRLGILGCVTAAIVFELSGPFIGMLGWPLQSVMCWGGWLFAAVVLVLRGEKRARAIVLLSVVLALAVYAGYPEGLLLLVLAAAIFALAMLLLRTPALGGSGPLIRPVFDLGLSAIAGSALAAPLLLPGLQLAKGSNRNVVGPALAPNGLPPQDLLHFIFQGFDGLPVIHSEWFGVSVYEFTAAYVGVTALVLSTLALALRWKRPEVRSIALVAVAMGLLVFVSPLVSILDSSVTRIYWIFARTPVVLALAVLSGIGMDVLVKSYSERRVQTCARHRIRCDGACTRDCLACGPTRTHSVAGEHPLTQFHLAQYRGGCRSSGRVDPDEGGSSDSDASCYICYRCRDRRGVAARPCDDRLPPRFGRPPYLVQRPLPNFNPGSCISKAGRWECRRWLWNLTCFSFKHGNHGERQPSLRRS